MYILYELDLSLFPIISLKSCKLKEIKESIDFSDYQRILLYVVSWHLFNFYGASSKVKFSSHESNAKWKLNSHNLFSFATTVML